MQQVITFAKGALALFLTVVMIAMAYLHFNKSDVARRVLTALNAQLETSIHAERFRLDVFTHFPYITARMQEVSVEGLGDSHLLDARELHVLLRPGRLLRGELEVSRLYIEDGLIDIIVLPDRTLSLNIFTQTPQKSDKPGVVLDFRRVVMKNVGLRFRDPAAGHEYSLAFDLLRMRGRMGYEQLHLDIDGGFKSNHVRIGDLTFLNACNGAVNGGMKMDFRRQLYTLEDLSLMLNGERFILDGSIRGDQAYTFVDLDVEHSAGNLARFSKLLPVSFQETLTSTGLEGKVGATGNIKGRMSKTENPYVQFDLNMPSGTVHVDSLIHLPDTIQGKFTNGGMRQMSSSVLDLHSIEGTWGEHSFSGMLRLIDLRDPALQVILHGTLPAAAISHHLPGIDIKSGLVVIDEIASGRLWINDLHYTDLQKIKAVGRLEQVSFRYGEKQGHIANAGLHFEKGILSLDSLDMKWERTSGKIDGTIFGLPDALQAHDAGLLSYDLDIAMDAVFADDLHHAEPITTNVHPVDIRTYAPLRLPAGSAHITADRVYADRLALSALESTVESHLHAIEFTGSFNGMEGAVEGTGSMQISDRYTLRTKLKCHDINVKQCFWQFRDFGQSTISAEQLGGQLDAYILSEVAWTPAGIVDRPSIRLQAGISLKDGELVNFGLLDRFSSYVHAEDLQHIKFQRLDNFIEIRNERIYLPVMFIQSNAVNLAVNGIHDFDNNILYNLKINAGQVLSQKMKVHDPGLTPIPARKEGTFNLYYTIKGNVNDFQYRSNKRGVTSGFSQSSDMRESIRQQLVAQFGEIDDLIEPAGWQNIPEYEDALGPQEFLDPIGGNRDN